MDPGPRRLLPSFGSITRPFAFSFFISLYFSLFHCFSSFSTLTLCLCSSLPCFCVFIFICPSYLSLFFRLCQVAACLVSLWLCLLQGEVLTVKGIIGRQVGHASTIGNSEGESAEIITAKIVRQKFILLQ